MFELIKNRKMVVISVLTLMLGNFHNRHISQCLSSARSPSTAVYDKKAFNEKCVCASREEDERSHCKRPATQRMNIQRENIYDAAIRLGTKNKCKVRSPATTTHQIVILLRHHNSNNKQHTILRAVYGHMAIDTSAKHHTNK